MKRKCSMYDVKQRKRIETKVHVQQGLKGKKGKKEIKQGCVYSKGLIRKRALD